MIDFSKIAVRYESVEQLAELLRLTDYPTHHVDYSLEIGYVRKSEGSPYVSNYSNNAKMPVAHYSDVVGKVEPPSGEILMFMDSNGERYLGHHHIRDMFSPLNSRYVLHATKWARIPPDECWNNV
jgi:hypothetical protein